jgi:hypothetical protein
LRWPACHDLHRCRPLPGPLYVYTLRFQLGVGQSPNSPDPDSGSEFLDGADDLLKRLKLLHHPFPALRLLPEVGALIMVALHFLLHCFQQALSLAAEQRPPPHARQGWDRRQRRQAWDAPLLLARCGNPLTIGGLALGLVLMAPGCWHGLLFSPL